MRDNSMVLKALVISLAAALAAANVVAQVAETIEVRVTNVDVVVTDGAGHPIHGLTRDDFELFENGKPQPLTNFYEIGGETPSPATPVAPDTATTPAAPAEMRQRSVVVFIDNSAIDPIRRNRVIDSVVRALDTILRPGDDAMIVMWNRRFEIMQPFTSDRAALKTVLENARKYGASLSVITVQKNEVVNYARALLAAVRAGRMRIDQAYADSVSAARSYAEWERQTEKLLLASVTQTISMLSGVEGKKVLLLVGGELEDHPGLDVFQMVDSMFAGSMRNAMPSSLGESDLKMTDDLVKLARNANANGVTMYMIDALDRTRDASQASLPDPEVEFTQQTNTDLSMAMIASNTGGTVLSGTHNFSVALDNISRDLGSYYSLGYKPPAAGGVDRRITVKVKRPGAFVRSRRGYALKTADEQLQDRVVANAFHSSLKSEFPVTITTDPPEPFQKGLFKLKVTVTFPSDLTYLPDGENLSGEYAVFFVTAAEDGHISKVAKQVQPVTFPASSAAAVKQRPFMHTASLIVRPGSQSISVAVFDRLGARTGFARATVIVR